MLSLLVCPKVITWSGFQGFFTFRLESSIDAVTDKVELNKILEMSDPSVKKRYQNGLIVIIFINFVLSIGLE